MFKKVLIINIFGIGDVLFTTPLISNIKEYYKDSSIGYLCSCRAKEVVESNPKIDKIFIYDRDDFYQIAKKSKIVFLKRLFHFFYEIKKEHYDMVIDLSLNTSMSFLTWIAGIRERIGFNYKNRSIFLNKKIKLLGYDNKHVVEYYLNLLKKINIPIKYKELELYLKPDDFVWADNFFKQNHLEDKKIVIGMCPGGGASWGKDANFKRLPAEKWAKIADKLIEKYSSAIILMGDVLERDLCQRIANLMRHRPQIVCGKTTVTQFGALVKKCSLIILNDGGPLHIAVASKARTISVFGPVNENVYGPYTKEKSGIVISDVLCRPCYRRFRKASCNHMSCLNNITIEEVLRKVEDFL
ncbi:MAG TPA: lipopolysaccharide heptosyltransferase II [Candidatus Omnitrophota bacterium]|nr:lipopolysaccharide heptosyltransferase II [Candidatus Omnitrophota bacterium]